MTNQEAILCSLLDCGTADLPMLEDINYDVEDIVQELSQDSCLSLNNIFESVFQRGISDLQGAVNDLKQDFENEDNKEDAEKLSCLNPEKDVEYFCNCLDTHVYFTNNEDTYRKYLAEEIGNIEDRMGFEF